VDTTFLVNQTHAILVLPLAVLVFPQVVAPLVIVDIICKMFSVMHAHLLVPLAIVVQLIAKVALMVTI